MGTTTRGASPSPEYLLELNSTLTSRRVPHKTKSPPSTREPPFNLRRNQLTIRGGRDSENRLPLSSIDIIFTNEHPFDDRSLNIEQFALFLQREPLLDTVDNDGDIPLLRPASVV
jgi:hypothetical protein